MIREWSEKLSELLDKGIVVWHPFEDVEVPNESDQTEEVHDAIKTEAIPKNKQELHDLLRDRQVSEKKCSDVYKTIDDLLSYYKKFQIHI